MTAAAPAEAPHPLTIPCDCESCPICNARRASFGREIGKGAEPSETTAERTSRLALEDVHYGLAGLEVVMRRDRRSISGAISFSRSERELLHKTRMILERTAAKLTQELAGFRRMRGAQ